MNSGVIVGLNKGQIFPVTLLEKLQKAHGNLLCFATADEGDITTISLPADKYAWEDSIKGLLEEYKDRFCAFHFGNHVNLPDAEEQPFPLIMDDAEKLILAAMVEGDLPNYAKGEGATNEFRMVRDFLDNTVKELYQEAGEDIAKMMAMAATPRFRKSLQPVLTPQGAILLIPAIGEPLLFAEHIMNEGGRGGKFNWGWTTRTLGYSEASKPITTVPAAPVLAPKAMTKREQLLARMAAAKSAEPLTETTEPPVEVQPEVEGKPVTDTPVPQQVVKCPNNLHGKNRKDWIHRNIQKPFQFMHKNGKPVWEGECEYLPHMLKPGSPATQLVKTFAEAAEKIAAKPARATPDTPLPKETEVVPGYVPAIPPKSKEHVANLIKDGTLEVSLPVVERAQMQNVEALYDSYSAQMAISEDVPLFYSPEGYLKLCQHDVHGAAALLEQFRWRILIQEPAIAGKMMELITAPAPAVKLTKKQELEARMKARSAAAA